MGLRQDALRDLDPRWKTSQGGSRVGLGAIYGESAQTGGATVVSGVRLNVRMTAEAVTEVVEYAGLALHSAVSAVSFCAED